MRIIMLPLFLFILKSIVSFYTGNFFQSSGFLFRFVTADFRRFAPLPYWFGRAGLKILPAHILIFILENNGVCALMHFSNFAHCLSPPKSS